MGSFALRMAAHQKAHHRPPGSAADAQNLELALSTTVPIRIVIDPSCESAVANATVGEPLVLAVDDHGKIAFVSKARELIGWLPPEDSLAPRLLDGAGHRAHLRKIIRGTYGRIKAVFVDVEIVGGTITVPST